MSMNESNNNNNNNNPASGRPPPPPPPPSAHRRAPSSMPAQGMPSLGEQAANANANNAPLLSPIVPPQEEGSQSNETRHNRKVSWGGVTSPTLNLTPSGVASALASIIPQQQTQQQASEVSNNAAASNPTSSFLDRLQKSQAPSTRRFNLNEMLGSGPVEQEAETCILRAVEKISGQRHQRTPTEMASLFSEIAADDIVRSMQQQQQNEEHSDSEDEDDFFEDAPALGSTEPKSSSFSSFGGEGAVRTGEYLAQIGSQEAIEVAAPTYCNLESIPSYGSNGTDNTASASSHEYPLLQTVASNKSVGRSTRSVVGGPAAAARSMRNLGGTAKSTRSLGNTEKSSRFLGTGAKSKLQSAVRKQMAANTVEQTLLGLTSTLNNMKEEEVRKKEHRRQATQINMTENEKLTETADALAGHLCNSADQNGAGNNTSSPSRVASDVEAPINSTKSNATAVDDIGDTDDSTHDGSSVHLSNGDPSLASGKNKKRKKHKHVISNNIKEDFQLLQDFLSNRKWQMQLYIQRVFLFIMIPSIAVAALLFYFVENPTLCQEEVERQVGSNGTDDEEGDSEVISFVCPDTGAASASWLILFIGVRQVITLTMALITQAIIVDYLCLNCRFSLRFLGPFITLFFVQARGWPFVAVFWAIYDLVLLAGDNDYTRHWGYWQEWVELFNANNPSGRVIEHELNYQILKLAIIVGIVVSIKRLFVSLYLGRATFAHFGEELAKVMKSMIIVGEVATLSKDIEYYAEQDQLDNMSVYHDNSSIAGGWNDKDIQQLVSKEADAERRAQAFKDSQVGSNAATAAKRFMANRATQAKTKPAPNVPNNGPPSFCSPTPSMGGASSTVVNEDFSASEKSKLSDLLEAWEEPQTAEQKEEKKITLGAVLQFRQALTFMQKRHPFLPAFGPADTRERCVESAQRCYERLMLRTPDRLELPFETIALLTKDDKGRINREKAKELIRVFRPDREGNITKLDFVRSVDAIYKSIRLLAANIRNSSQIDMAVEGIINTIFYIVLGSFVLGQLGVNPLQLFFSLSSVILAFAFMFSNSSSKYFEGMLFILVQRPYGVGDRIHLSNPQLETNIDGSSGWIVEKVSLYTTSLYWGATNERCTIANGAISNLRVINAARSPHAQIFVNMKFAIDTEYEKIVIFKAAVEEFLKDRPREWLTFVGFRPTEVAVERGFINYVTIAQHRASWQDIGAVLSSKAELVTYELEVAKQLQMRYLSPPLPVNLTLKGTSTNEMTPDMLKGMTGWS